MSLLQFRFILLFFILSFIFILEIGLSVCVTLSSIYHILPCNELWFIIQSCYLINVPTRDFYTMPSFGKNINE
jgi:hypothetical protein